MTKGKIKNKKGKKKGVMRAKGKENKKRKKKREMKVNHNGKQRKKKKREKKAKVEIDKKEIHKTSIMNVN